MLLNVLRGHPGRFVAVIEPEIPARAPQAHAAAQWIWPDGRFPR